MRVWDWEKIDRFLGRVAEWLRGEGRACVRGHTPEETRSEHTYETVAYRALGECGAVAQLRDVRTGDLIWRYRAHGATVDFKGNTWPSVDAMAAALLEG